MTQIQMIVRYFSIEQLNSLFSQQFDHLGVLKLQILKASQMLFKP